MKIINIMWSAVLALVVAGCGGGGGSAGTSSGGGSGGTTGKATLTLTLRNASGATTNSVSFSGATTARAVVLDGTGIPVAGKLVTFTADTGLIKFVTPASGSVLTDSNGVATVQIGPASLTASGAGTIKASGSVSGTGVSDSLDFQLTAANLALQSLDVGTTPLAAYGNRPITVVATVDGTPSVSNPIQVTFTASCGTISPSGVTTDASGKASTTYKADSVICAGTNVTITASASGATPVSGAIAVQGVTGSNLVFVSATPARIYLAGSVGATQSLLVFKLIDSGGSPLQNQAISMSLTNTSTGTSIGSPGNVLPVTRTTDADGLVSAPVFSGTVPTSVQVKAVLVSNSAVTTSSNTLTVASGRPVQSSASISSAKLSIEGWDYDGETTSLTMRIHDRQGNPVPDGTEINFVTDGGYVVPAVCLVTGGSSACSVTLTSSNPRPATGRVRVLAYTPGEEDFVDLNGNNMYDLGEPFTDLGNAYRDDNENGQYDPGEFVVPRIGSVACSGGSAGAKNTCDGMWGTVDVRAGMTIVFATSVLSFSGVSASVDSVNFVLSDQHGNGAPGGTTISAKPRTKTGSSCGVGTVIPTPLLDSLLPTNGVVGLLNCAKGDIIDITATTPKGVGTIYSVTIP